MEKDGKLAGIGVVGLCTFGIGLLILTASDLVVLPTVVILIGLIVWLVAGGYFVSLAVSESRRKGAGRAKALGRGLLAIPEYIFYFGP